MQVDPSLRPNYTRVLDAIEYLLKQIKPANSNSDRAYFTDGVVVDRRRDPRKVYADKAQEVISVGSYIRIKEGAGKVVLKRPEGYVGNSYRTESAVSLICWSVMTAAQDQARITSDQLTAWLRHDIDVALSNDSDGTDCITRASAALATLPGDWGVAGMWGPRPSCFNLRITGWQDGPLSTWPWVLSAVSLQFWSDAHGSGRLEGTL